MSVKEKINEINKKLTGMLDIPGEVIFNLPLISIVGKQEIRIENFKGVIEFNEERIRLNTVSGVLCISGKNFVLKQITAESILISGEMFKLEYLI